jgi:type IV secretion system protein VirD4
LREVYGVNAAETMLKSLAARIVFAPKDVSDAREISDELGNTTINVRTLSKPALDFSDAKGRRHRSVSISEQRRALLLPQEVKALGNDHAIIFYEGLRPIRCKKIRYFQDKRFAQRLLPPLVVERREVVAPIAPRPRDDAASIEPSAPASEGTGPGEASSPADVIREATVEDIDRIDSLTLEDFAADFSAVNIPTEGPLSEQAMHEAVEGFLATLRER